MKRSRFVGLAVLVATAVSAVFAGTASPAAAAPSAAQSTGVMHVGFAVQKFVKHGKTLVAIGQTIATVTTDQGTYTSAQPFTSTVTRKGTAHVAGARTTQQASRICNVLNLTLGPLHLALLGLIIDLDKVVLNITADSNGGLLGSLLCGLAGGGGVLGTTANAANLTKAAKSSGLALGPGFNIPVNAVSTSGASAGTQAAQAVCTVLDLTVGPLDLNLLGLMVHLDKVHLLITADPNGGLLGSLLCSLAGGVPTTPAVPTG
jgi:hypothetical protein